MCINKSCGLLYKRFSVSYSTEKESGRCLLCVYAGWRFDSKYSAAVLESLPSFREEFSEGRGFASVPLRLHILTCIQSPHACFQKVTEFFLNNYLTSFYLSRVIDPLPVPLLCVLAKFKPVRSTKGCSAAVVGERVLNHQQISFSWELHNPCRQPSATLLQKEIFWDIVSSLLGHTQRITRFWNQK